MAERRLVEFMQHIDERVIIGATTGEIGAVMLAKRPIRVLPCFFAMRPFLSPWRLSKPGWSMDVLFKQPLKGNSDDGFMKPDAHASASISDRDLGLACFVFGILYLADYCCGLSWLDRPHPVGRQ